MTLEEYNKDIYQEQPKNQEQEAVFADTKKETKKLSDTVFWQKFGTLLEKVSALLGITQFQKTPETAGSTQENTTERNTENSQANPQESEDAEIVSSLDISEEDFSDVLGYLAHQQGAGGIKHILQAAQAGEKPSPSLHAAMAANIDLKTYNRIYGTHYKKMNELKPHLTASKFLSYRTYVFQEKKKEYSQKDTYDDIILPLAQKYDIAPEVIRTYIGIESGFNAKAVSPSGNHVGLMQIGVPAAQDVGYTAQDRYDFAKNIEMGVKLMAKHQNAIATLTPLTIPIYETLSQAS